MPAELSGDAEAAQTHRLLLIDDDASFREVLSRAFARRGYRVTAAPSVDAGLALARAQVPDYAVVDLRLPGDSGLVAVDGLHRLNRRMRILVLTGYASIATTVEAIKLGAVNYLAKPADAEQILQALAARAPDPATMVSAVPMSVQRIAWEHLQRVLHENGGNISETARVLGLHRRTLQRKLMKRPSTAAYGRIEASRLTDPGAVEGGQE
jgi:two-component system, response regulator RegA